MRIKALKTTAAGIVIGLFGVGMGPRPRPTDLAWRLRRLDSSEIPHGKDIRRRFQLLPCHVQKKQERETGLGY
jgi:hypothetical protein